MTGSWLENKGSCWYGQSSPLAGSQVAWGIIQKGADWLARDSTRSYSKQRWLMIKFYWSEKHDKTNWFDFDYLQKSGFSFQDYCCREVPSLKTGGVVHVYSRCGYIYVCVVSRGIPLEPLVLSVTQSTVTNFPCICGGKRRGGGGGGARGDEAQLLYCCEFLAL